LRKSVLAGAALAAVATAAVPAVAAAPLKTTEDIVGSASFVKNRYFKLTMRYKDDVVTVKSGGRITINNKGPKDEPHTFSIVKHSDWPKNLAAGDACFEKGICGRLAGEHQFPEGQGPPKVITVNHGAAGFNTVGDSIVIAPRGEQGSTQFIQVTAAKGKTLYFMCIIHPWMRGQIKVG
jgi:hypothetical protein